MKIAVSSNGGGAGGEISGHFGRCPEFVIFDCENTGIIGVEQVQNPYFKEHVPDAVPKFISSLNADVMIAGGMGPRAVEIFGSMGIKVVLGTSGNIKKAVEAYLSGELVPDENTCTH
ncbi:MAG: NifB/NifX family molybdenum-iron cluster-binding protein [Candidatus Micrarchaeota archaeon]